MFTSTCPLVHLSSTTSANVTKLQSTTAPNTCINTYRCTKVSPYCALCAPLAKAINLFFRIRLLSIWTVPARAPAPTPLALRTPFHTSCHCYSTFFVPISYVNNFLTQTHTHTHKCKYINIYMCVFAVFVFCCWLLLFAAGQVCGRFVHMPHSLTSQGVVLACKCMGVCVSVCVWVSGARICCSMSMTIMSIIFVVQWQQTTNGQKIEANKWLCHFD